MDFTRRISRFFLLVGLCGILMVAAAAPALGAAKTTITPVSSDLMPPEQTVSLELKGTDIRDALEALTKLTGTNIIADQGVKGEITLSLSEVPFQKALDLIIKANGFSYRWVGNIVVVAAGNRLDEALDEQTVQVYSLKYAKPADVAKALGLVVPAASIVPDDRTKSIVVKGTPAALVSAKQMVSMLDVEEAKVSRVFPLKGTATEALRQAVMSAAPSGSVTVNAGGKSIIVKATPTELTEAERIIGNLDKDDKDDKDDKVDKVDKAKEEAQVQAFPLKYASPADVKSLVETAAPGSMVAIGPGGKSLVVKAVASQLAQLDKVISGIDMSVAPPPPAEVKVAPPVTTAKVYTLKYAGTDDVKGALTLLVPAASVQIGVKDRSIVVKGTADDLKKADDLVARLDVAPRQVVIEARIEELSVTAYQKLGIDWSWPTDSTTGNILKKDAAGNVTGVQWPSLSAALQAMENDGNASVLANPRISVVDGKEASIHIGDRIPIVVETETTENGVTKNSQTVDYITAGIILKVTPRFNENNALTVTVSPEVSNIVGQTTQGYPQIRTRSATTTMVVKDGDTIALGGLISESDTDTVKKVPVVGDIPLLGRLFQTTTKDKKQNEIVIFLTTRIVPNGTTAPVK